MVDDEFKLGETWLFGPKNIKVIITAFVTSNNTLTARPSEFAYIISDTNSLIACIIAVSLLRKTSSGDTEKGKDPKIHTEGPEQRESDLDWG